MIAKAESGRYRAKPVKVFGFEEIVEAHRAMEQGLAAGKDGRRGELDTVRGVRPAEAR